VRFWSTIFCICETRRQAWEPISPTLVKFVPTSFPRTINLWTYLNEDLTFWKWWWSKWETVWVKGNLQIRGNCDIKTWDGSAATFLLWKSISMLDLIASACFQMSGEIILSNWVRYVLYAPTTLGHVIARMDQAATFPSLALLCHDCVRRQNEPPHVPTGPQVAQPYPSQPGSQV
jgi:hypothetical protein